MWRNADYISAPRIGFQRGIPPIVCPFASNGVPLGTGLRTEIFSALPSGVAGDAKIKKYLVFFFLHFSSKTSVVGYLVPHPLKLAWPGTR